MTGDECYQFLRTLFGMRNPKASLVCRMRKLFQGLDHFISYINDLVVHAKLLGDLHKNAGLAVKLFSAYTFCSSYHKMLVWLKILSLYVIFLKAITLSPMQS